VHEALDFHADVAGEDEEHADRVEGPEDQHRAEDPEGVLEQVIVEPPPEDAARTLGEDVAVGEERRLHRDQGGQGDEADRHGHEPGARVLPGAPQVDVGHPEKEDWDQPGGDADQQVAVGRVVGPEKPHQVGGDGVGGLEGGLFRDEINQCHEEEQADDEAGKAGQPLRAMAWGLE
jgi:hypothetical protein